MKKVMGIVFLLFGAASAQTLSVIKTSTILDGKGHILKDKVIVINGTRIVSILNARGNPTYDLSRPDRDAGMDRYACASGMALQQGQSAG